MAWPMITPLHPLTLGGTPKKSFSGTDWTERIGRWERTEAAHRAHYNRNLALISQAFGGQYAVVHDDGYGYAKVSACESKEARANYLRRLTLDTRKGSYVPSKPVPIGIRFISEYDIFRAVGLIP